MPVIEFPSSTAANIASTAGAQLSQFSSIITLIVGVLLAMLAIDFLIGSFHKPR